MPVVPGTTVKVVFYSFTGTNPRLYYAKQGGKLNLASVNAGNSNADGLCVGLKGVNGAFFDILSATQKRVNNSTGQHCRGGANDDYQDRHLKLLATADSGGTPWTSYSNTDPCALSFVNLTRISKAAGFCEGVCFVDAFDPKLCPEDNPRNAFMLYAAPPFDGNYATPADFLKAIEAMAGNIVKTISTYNALAAQNNWLLIESLRNTLFSSNLYNQHLKVPLDDIARAIFAGFTAELNNDSNSGLVELQFPVGDSAVHQATLFAIVEQDLAQQAAAAGAAAPSYPVIGGGAMPAPDPNDDNDPLEPPAQPVQVPDDQGEDPDSLEIGAQSQNLTQAATALENATNSLDPFLKPGTKLPSGNYQSIPAVEHVYIGPEAGFEEDAIPMRVVVRSAQADLAGPTGDAVRATAKAAQDVLTAKNKLLNAGTLAEARVARDQANAAAWEAKEQADLAEFEANQPGATERQQDAADAARDIAKKSGALALEMETALGTQEALAKIVYRDVNGRLAVGRVLGPVVGFTVASVAAGLIAFLGWLFGSPGGRLLRNRPTNKDLTRAWLDDGTTADVDVLGGNAALDSNFDPTLVHAVHLFQNSQQSDSVGTAGTTDVWTATSTSHITFAPLKPPASGTTVTIPYILEFISGSIGNPLSTATNLTITFVDKASRLVQTAAASSASQAITAVFPIPLPDQFVFTPSDPSAWTLDKANKTLTYVPPASVTSATVSENYFLGLGLNRNASTVVVLLPPADLTALSASPTSMMVSFPALPDPGQATWTLLLPSGSAAPNNKITVTGGDWSLAMNTIMFKPSTKTPPSGTLSVQFALMLDNVFSGAGNATINFTPTTPPKPTTMDITIVAANRTDSTFPIFPKGIPAAITNFKFTSLTTTPGTWANPTAAGGPTFAPLTPFPATTSEATNSYTADGLMGTVTIIFPLDIVMNSVNRQQTTTIPVYGNQNPLLKDNFKISVHDTVPPADSSNATWTDGSTLTPAEPGTLLFTPPSDVASMNTPGAVLQIGFVTKVYVLTFPDGSQTTASLTLNFTTDLTAYDFTYNAQASENLITLNFLAHCYIPSSPGFRDATLEGDTSMAYVENNPQTNAVAATWNAPATNVITLAIQDSSLLMFQADYYIHDLNNNAVHATITVQKPMMAMPMAADYMMTKDVWTPMKPADERLAAPVLSICSSFYDIDPASVVITGLFDMGQDFTAAPAAILQNNGKALRIPDEGSWLVDNSGLIGFQAVPGLTHPPTPIAYQFSDKKGNLSNQGKIVIDPLLDQATSLAKNLSAMGDTAFWTWFQIHVSRWYPHLSHDEFIATTTILAGATRTLGKVGRNPVSGEAFATAFETWSHKGKHWDDAAGAAHPAGLFTLCRELVEPATQGTSLLYRARYWRLLTMSRMTAHSPILPILKH